MDCELFDGVRLTGGGPWVGELELDLVGLWSVDDCGVKGFKFLLLLGWGDVIQRK